MLVGKGLREQGGDQLGVCTVVREWPGYESSCMGSGSRGLKLQRCEHLLLSPCPDVGTRRRGRVKPKSCQQSNIKKEQKVAQTLLKRVELGSWVACGDPLPPLAKP